MEQMVTEEQLQALYEKFMGYVKIDKRAEKLLVMYNDFNEQLSTAPASARTYYHNSFPGGYLDHTVRVVDTALELSVTYKKMGGTIDFSKQELIFSAIHHDLGKLGSPDEGPYYLDQDSDWHRKRGEVYKHNDSLQYMKVVDRALFLLQKYEIEITQKEWIAIKLSDGMYNEASKAYLTNHTPYAMKTNLPYIIHWADHMASQVEKDSARF
jgi:hypothetical protein